MSYQRGAQNKRDFIRKQEEEMDSKLKELDCWEENLTRNDKIEILKFVKESEDPARQECPESSEAAKTSDCPQKKIENVVPEMSKISPFLKEDSPEPMIMYDSFTNKSISSRRPSESSSEEELTIFGKTRGANLMGTEAPRSSSADKNIASYENTQSKRVSLVKFDNIDKLAEKFDIGNNSNSVTVNKLDFTLSDDDISNKMTTISKIVPIKSLDIEDSVECKPLKARKAFKREDPSTVYYQNSTETKEECVERILSMISDFQDKLKIYQRNSDERIPWGPPITVKNMPSSGLAYRRQRSKKMNNEQKYDNVYTFNTSITESSSDEAKTSEDEWIDGNEKEIISRHKGTSSPNHQVGDVLSESSKHNGLQNDDDFFSDDNFNGVIGEAIVNNPEFHHRSIKRKTFSLHKKHFLNRTENETNEPALKKQKIYLRNGNTVENLSDSEEIKICPSQVIKKGRRYLRKAPPLQDVHIIQSVEDDHSIPSTSAGQCDISVPSGNFYSPAADKKTIEIELIPCPLCQKEFPIETIEAHASDCMVDCGDMPFRRNSEDDIVCLERQIDQ